MKYKRYFNPFNGQVDISRNHMMPLSKQNSGNCEKLSNHNHKNNNKHDKSCHTENSNLCLPQKKTSCNHKKHNELSGLSDFLCNLKFDDVLLIGLIVVLLNNEKEKDNQAFVIGLMFLFLAEYIDLNSILSTILG